MQPEPISESELYDPEAPEPKVRQLFTAPIEELPRPQEPQPEPPCPGPKPKDMTAIYSAALDILSFRLIMLVCVVASAGMFGLTVIEPDPWRLGAAAAFSLIVTAPVVYFYRRA
jgi:hypothetical protein